MHRVILVAIVACVITGCNIEIGGSYAAPPPPRLGIEDAVTYDVPRAGIERLSCTNANGTIRVAGSNAGANHITIHAEIRASAPRTVDAWRCRDAIEIVRSTAGGVLQVSWRWIRAPEPEWQASVDFDISMPANLDIKCRATNGFLEVHGVDGAIDVEVINGDLTIAESGSTDWRLSATNGSMRVEGAPRHAELVAVGGAVDATFLTSGPLDATIRATEGSVSVRLGHDVSAKIECAVLRGTVHGGDLIDAVATSDATVFVGRTGAGAGRLLVDVVGGDVSFVAAPQRTDR